jgi:hypothetical protein
MINKNESKGPKCLYCGTPIIPGPHSKKYCCYAHGTRANQLIHSIRTDCGIKKLSDEEHLIRLRLLKIRKEERKKWQE